LFDLEIEQFACCLLIIQFVGTKLSFSALCLEWTEKVWSVIWKVGTEIAFQHLGLNGAIKLWCTVREVNGRFTVLTLSPL